MLKGLSINDKKEIDDINENDFLKGDLLSTKAKIKGKDCINDIEEFKKRVERIKEKYGDSLLF